LNCPLILVLQLARSGFFFRPAPDSLDNVQCFHCSVKLDGWEPDDDPFKEHLAHSASCNWANAISAGHSAQQVQQNGDDAALLQQQDPMGAELLAARRGTFEANETLWPHESKKGWKCKVGKMIEAGWCYDPAPATSTEDEEQDGVTCFYCNLSLDGWEPKDDPFEEHTRRSPDCVFFALMQIFRSGTAKKGAKGKGKKGPARSSAASKASRLSTQSVLSQFSEAPDLAGTTPLPAEDIDMEPAGADDSIVSTASQATATGTGKGKKGKGGRAKAPAKGAKGRKRAGTVDSQAEAPSYPDLGSQLQSQATKEEEIVASLPEPVEEAAPALAKKTRKGPARGSKALQIDSSVIEISALDLATQPATKAKRGRKPKAKAEPDPQPEIEAAEADDTEVSAQLQEELERSLSIDMDARFETEEQVASQPEKPKRGVKRTSDGMKKSQQPREDSDVSATVVEFPIPPKPAAPAAKVRKGRKASKQVEPEPEPVAQPPAATQEDVSMSDVEAAKPAKGKKAPASNGKGRGKKASSIRSSRSSKATITEPPQPQEEEEDLERDEREIEAELQRIATEQAKIETEQDKTAEYEASPSQQTRRVSKHSELKVVETVAGSPPTQSPVLLKKANPMSSPAGSDKENDPSSASLTKPSTQPILSPTKTTRIPLAPGTPNRLLASPSKRTLLSPSKQISHLTSTKPWEAIDLDAVLLASPQPTPGTLAARLAGAAVGAGMLASPEKGMTVEEWVQFQSQKAEEELRRKCEEMVGAFEREGMRALGCLEGIRVVG
jgi:hypothetical protein